MLMTLYAATIDLAGRATNDVLPGSESTFGAWISRIAGAVMVISALLLLIYLLWGGISWITAGGESSKVQAAKDRITQAVIGIIVLASTLAIFLLVQSFLGIEVFNVSSNSGATKSPIPANQRVKQYNLPEGP